MHKPVIPMESAWQYAHGTNAGFLLSYTILYFHPYDCNVLILRDVTTRTHATLS